MLRQSLLFHSFGFVFILVMLPECLSTDLSQKPIVFPSTFIPNRFMLEEGIFDGIADDITQMSNASLTFAVEVSKRVSRLFPGNGTNAVMAPYAVWQLLTTLAGGSSGLTYEQLAMVLYQPSDFSKVHEAYRVFEYTTDGNISAYIKLQQAKVLFYDEHRPLDVEYQEALELVYGTNYEPIDFFDPDTAVHAINNYVRENTREKITKVVESKDMSQTFLMPLSAVHFDAEWNTPHEKKLRIQPFYSETGKFMDNVPFVVRKGDAADLGTKIVEVPYGEGDKYILYLLLPERNLPVQALIDGMDVAMIQGVFQFMSSRERNPNAYVYVPRFSINTAVKLNGVLKTMGLSELFGGEANIPKITPHPVNPVSFFHKTVFEMEDSNPSDDYKSTTSHMVNRPFVFVFFEKTTKAIILSGVIKDPRN